MQPEPPVFASNSPALSLAPRGGGKFLLSLAGLFAVCALPETILWLRGSTDLHAFVPIVYYEAVFSAVALLPAAWLPRPAAHIWVAGFAAIAIAPTILAVFQAVTVGARWDGTAHAALLETNHVEAWGFLKAFAGWETVGAAAGVIAAFALCVKQNVDASPPPRRMAAIVTGLALALGSYGIRNVVRHGSHPIHDTVVDEHTTLRLMDATPNAYHPVLRLAVTHWNWAATHAYRRAMLEQMDRHIPELAGATVVPGATPPRIVVLVIGESASRRHWSLYGYRRDTNPELRNLLPEIVVFRDVVSRTVGTLTEIQGMLCDPASSLPVLSLFALAGYKTHWFSAQLDQGPTDVKMAALVQRCDERRFLNGAYDENLVPLVQRAIAAPGKHIIVVNLFGSHVRYDDRYPSSFAVFQGTGDKGHRLAAYDNSIRYTDHVLRRIIELLRTNESEPSCFLYVSDHAEDVYDSTPNEYLFRSDSVATDAMYEVPMVAWFSTAYRDANPDVVANATRCSTMPIQSLGLYHTLIDLVRLRHSIYAPHRSFASAQYTPAERHVGALGRIYHGPALPTHASAKLHSNQ